MVLCLDLLPNSFTGSLSWLQGMASSDSISSIVRSLRVALIDFWGFPLQYVSTLCKRCPPSWFQFSLPVLSPYLLPTMILPVTTPHLTSRLFPHPPSISILFSLHSNIHVFPCNPSLLFKFSWSVDFRIIIQSWQPIYTYNCVHIMFAFLGLDYSTL